MGNSASRTFLSKQPNWHELVEAEWRSERVRDLDDLGGLGREVVGRGQSMTARLALLEADLQYHGMALEKAFAKPAQPKPEAGDVVLNVEIRALERDVLVAGAELTSAQSSTDAIPSLKQPAPAPKDWAVGPPKEVREIAAPKEFSLLMNVDTLARRKLSEARRRMLAYATNVNVVKGAPGIRPTTSVLRVKSKIAALWKNQGDESDKGALNLPSNMSTALDDFDAEWKLRAVGALHKNNAVVAGWRWRVHMARRRVMLVVMVMVRWQMAARRKHGPSRLQRVDSFSYYIPQMLGDDQSKFVDEVLILTTAKSTMGRCQAQIEQILARRVNESEASAAAAAEAIEPMPDVSEADSAAPLIMSRYNSQQLQPQSLPSGSQTPEGPLRLSSALRPYSRQASSMSGIEALYKHEVIDMHGVLDLDYKPSPCQSGASAIDGPNDSPILLSAASSPLHAPSSPLIREAGQSGSLAQPDFPLSSPMSRQPTPPVDNKHIAASMSPRMRRSENGINHLNMSNVVNGPSSPSGSLTHRQVLAVAECQGRRPRSRMSLNGATAFAAASRNSLSTTSEDVTAADAAHQQLDPATALQLARQQQHSPASRLMSARRSDNGRLQMAYSAPLAPGIGQPTSSSSRGAMIARTLGPSADEAGMQQARLSGNPFQYSSTESTTPSFTRGRPMTAGTPFGRQSWTQMGQLPAQSAPSSPPVRSLSRGASDRSSFRPSAFAAGHAQPGFGPPGSSDMRSSTQRFEQIYHAAPRRSQSSNGSLHAAASRPSTSHSTSVNISTSLLPSRALSGTDRTQQHHTSRPSTAASSVRSYQSMGGGSAVTSRATSGWQTPMSYHDTECCVSDMFTPVFEDTEVLGGDEAKLTDEEKLSTLMEGVNDEVARAHRAEQMLSMFISRGNAGWAEAQSWGLPQVVSNAQQVAWRADAASVPFRSQTMQRIKKGQVAVHLDASQDFVTLPDGTTQDIWTADPWQLVAKMRPGSMPLTERVDGVPLGSRMLQQLVLGIQAISGAGAAQQVLVVLAINEEQRNTVVSDIVLRKAYGFNYDNLIVTVQRKRHAYRFCHDAAAFLEDPSTPAAVLGSGYALLQLAWLGDAFTVTAQGECLPLYMTVLERFAAKEVEYLISRRARDLALCSRDGVFDSTDLAHTAALLQEASAGIVLQAAPSSALDNARAFDSLLMSLSSQSATATTAAAAAAGQQAGCSADGVDQIAVTCADMRAAEIGSPAMVNVQNRIKTQSRGESWVGLQRYTFHVPALKKLLLTPGLFRPKLALQGEMVRLSLHMSDCTTAGRSGACLAVQAKQTPAILASARDINALIPLLQAQERDPAFRATLGALTTTVGPQATVEVVHAPRPRGGQTLMVFVADNDVTRLAVNVAVKIARPGRDAIRLVTVVPTQAQLPAGQQLVVKYHKQIMGAMVEGHLDVLVKGYKGLLDVMEGHVSATKASLVIMGSNVLAQGAQNLAAHIGSVTLSCMKRLTLPFLVLTNNSRNLAASARKTELRTLAVVEPHARPLLHYLATTCTDPMRGDLLLLAAVHPTRQMTSQQQQRQKRLLASFADMAAEHHILSTMRMQLDGQVDKAIAAAVESDGVHVAGVQIPAGTKGIPHHVLTLIRACKGGVLLYRDV